MTLNDFIGLNTNDQATAVWAGEFLETRRLGGFTVALWAVDNFFVEVFYSNKDNAIVRLRPFKTTDPLKPYLENMAIEPLDDL